MRKLPLTVSVLLALGLSLSGTITFAQNDLTDEEDIEISITVNEITEDPEEYLGKTVTVNGEIKKVYGPKAFKIGDEDLFFDEEMLVVGTKPFTAIPEKENEYLFEEYDVEEYDVMITGTVRKFSVTDVEDTIGWDLDPIIESEFNDSDLVLIATSVEEIIPK